MKSSGSSPLTRGKPGREHHQPVQAGLIPAHAGKTVKPGFTSPRTAAHPRSRGENGVRIWIATVRTGSSPLTRGKRHHGCSIRSTRGLIPAHAGKTETA